MKKLKKRLLAAALTSMAAATMAMPSFATEWTFKPYWPTQQSSNYLNINRPGSGVNMKGKNLTLYRTSNPGFDQKFTVNNTIYKGKPCTYYTRLTVLPLPGIMPLCGPLTMVGLILPLFRQNRILVW